MTEETAPETGPESTETDETPAAEVITPDDGDAAISLEAARKLRSEAKALRERTKAAETKADDYAQRLHVALVEKDGRLQDGRALPFREENLEGDTLADAISALLEDHPYLKARKITGDVGQGVHGGSVAPVDFSDLFR